MLAYLAVTLLLTFSSTHVGPRPRFVLAMLPLFAAAGHRCGGTYRVLLALSAGLLPLATVVYLLAPRGAP